MLKSMYLHSVGGARRLRRGIPAAARRGAAFRERFLLAALLILFAPQISASQEATCLAPTMEVEIFQASLLPGTETLQLHLNDPNPAERVSGYNFYRSADPSAPAESWSLLALDAMDENAAEPGMQWTEPVGGTPPATGIDYYLAAAYNGPCATEGPWMSPSFDDVDRDGVADHEDPCPTTTPGATPLVPGCSAADLMFHPEVLVEPAGEGIRKFLVDNVDVIVPDGVLPNLDEAQLGLEAAYADLQGVQPCQAETSLGLARLYLQDARAAIGAYLLTLPAAGGATAEGVSPYYGTEGPVTWPSPEHLYWVGQDFVLSLAEQAAADGEGIAAEVCSSTGPTESVAGRVQSLSDGEHRVMLESGESFLIGPQAVVPNAPISEDSQISIESTEFLGDKIGTYFDLMPSGYPFIPGLTYDNCLQLRVLPVQPLPGYPIRSTSWEVHPLDGYLAGGRLELNVGAQLIADDNGCPGVIVGGGPSGEDMRLDYYYQIFLTYYPKTGAQVPGLQIGYQVDGDSYPIQLPEMRSDLDATLLATKYKRTCLDSGLDLPVIDPQSGNVVGTKTLWNCSPEQIVGQPLTQPMRVREVADFCSVDYSATFFDVEDHEPSDWRQTSAVSVGTDPTLAPGPVAFAAFGDKIVGGMPVHDQPIALGDPFAIYNPFGHSHVGHGTDHRSFLDWPHVTGTRLGFPFRYGCGVPRLVTDVVTFCNPGPRSYYRLPFPSGEVTTVGQGNFGTTSHNTWQNFALDLLGNLGEPIVAARGGTVVSTRNNMTVNCKDENCEVIPGLCPNTGLPMLDEYGNHVAIQHQDGTVAWYAHMVPSTVAVIPGQRVKRGEYLGQMGDFGFSCGPHVHFHVTPEDPNKWGSDTVYIQYEAGNFPFPDVLTCMVPLENESYWSTNLP